MIIPEYVNGPPGVGHGGYVAGALAALLGTGQADVFLRAPTPLGRDLRVAEEPDHVELFDEDLLLAEASMVDIPSDPLPFVGLSVALIAGQGYRGQGPNRYETCFGCGRLREDGLGVGVGPVTSRVSACVWHPRGRTATEWVWAALDCATGWAWPLDEVHLVTGRLQGEIADDPAGWDPAGPYVIVAGQIQQTGRKYLSAASVFSAGGQRLAWVRGTWIAAG